MGRARTVKDQYVQLRRIRFRGLRRPHDTRVLTEHNEDDTNRDGRPRVLLRILVLQAPVWPSIWPVGGGAGCVGCVIGDTSLCMEFDWVAIETVVAFSHSCL